MKGKKITIITTDEKSHIFEGRYILDTPFESHWVKIYAVVKTEKTIIALFNKDEIISIYINQDEN